MKAQELWRLFWASVCSFVLMEFGFLTSYRWLAKPSGWMELVTITGILGVVVFLPQLIREDVPSWLMVIAATALVVVVITSSIRLEDWRNDNMAAWIVQAIATLVLIQTLIEVVVKLQAKAERVAIRWLLLVSLILDLVGLLAYQASDFSDHFRQYLYWFIVAGVVGLVTSLLTILFRYTKRKVATSLEVNITHAV